MDHTPVKNNFASQQRAWLYREINTQENLQAVGEPRWEADNSNIQATPLSGE